MKVYKKKKKKKSWSPLELCGLSPIFPRRKGNEAQRGSAACPRSHSRSAMELALGCRAVTQACFSMPWHQFPVAAVTNDNKSCGLKQEECVLSRIWRLEVQSQGVSRVVLLLEALREIWFHDLFEGYSSTCNNPPTSKYLE